MCNRFAGEFSEPQLRIRFRLDGTLFDVESSYNIAPTHVIPVVTEKEADGQLSRLLEGMRWGLLPAWKQAQGDLQGWTNAKAETLSELRSFKQPFERRRCLVPATGFYEWQTLDKKTKQPFHFRRRDAQPFAFAGVWEPLRETIGAAKASVAIVTTTPNTLMTPIHNRMPVILRQEDEERWLDSETPPEELLAMLRPYPDAELEAYPVDRQVGKPAFNSPDCVVPLSSDNLPGLFATA